MSCKTSSRVVSALRRATQRPYEFPRIQTKAGAGYLAVLLVKSSQRQRRAAAFTCMHAWPTHGRQKSRGDVQPSGRMNSPGYKP